MGVPPLGALSGLFVLIVEDHDDARHILESFLTYHGALVSATVTAAGAVTILGQIKADVVVCDVNLGDNDALWLIQQVREHQSDVPFIAISGQDYDEYEMRLAGFTTYLRKPVQQDVLVSRILRALER